MIFKEQCHHYLTISPTVIISKNLYVYRICKWIRHALRHYETNLKTNVLFILNYMTTYFDFFSLDTLYQLSFLKYFESQNV